MPSFDVVSELDGHEVANAVDQANREVDTRFDFKGSGARFEVADFVVSLEAQADFQLKQMIDILTQKLSRRGIDVACMKVEDAEIALNKARQKVLLKHGIESDLARKIVKLVKESKLKVQSQIQGDQVRITGKKRDDLQDAIALLKKAELGLPLQFSNFRD
jgi:cyclic-di-GMP-binding protein